MPCELSTKINFDNFKNTMDNGNANVTSNNMVNLKATVIKNQDIYQ